MINFINEHWLGLIIYLVGCVLAWGRINSQIYTDWSESTDFRGFKIAIVTFSWIGFLFSTFMWSGDAKFFKWLPILLLWCMIGVGCENVPTTVTKDRIPSADLRGYTEVEIIIIDECQYLISGQGHSRVMTHKGNCNNPIHRPLDTLK